MTVVHCEANHIIEDTQQRAAAAASADATDMAPSRPALAETASVAEVLAIAESVHAPAYFVHQSTPEAVDLVSHARHRGIPAFTETVTHHLVLDDPCYTGPEPERFVCCPPLRPAGTAPCSARYSPRRRHDHRQRPLLLRPGPEALASQDVRDMPNGLPGVELGPRDLLRVRRDRSHPATRFVELTSTNPARPNGLYPRKGSCCPGPTPTSRSGIPGALGRRGAELHQATDYTPYEGMAITGRPTPALVGGRVVVHDGALLEDAPRGRHLPAGAIELTPAALAR